MLFDIDDDMSDTNDVESKLTDLLSAKEKKLKEDFEEYRADDSTVTSGKAKGKQGDSTGKNKNKASGAEASTGKNGKHGKKEDAKTDPASEGEDEDEDEAPIPEIDAEEYLNPFLECFNQWMAAAPPDMKDVFRVKFNEDRRIELLDMLPSLAQKRYAWAIPDQRAIDILYSFAPIVEVAAGKGYWGYVLQKYHTQILADPSSPAHAHVYREELSTVKSVYTGYDMFPYAMADETKADLVREWNAAREGSIVAKKKAPKFKQDDKNPAWCKIKYGSSEVLSKHHKDTLFLCYPDEFEDTNVSVAMKCLKQYKGDTIILVGERFEQTLIGDNPWGKSASDEFQMHLAAQFHRVLEVSLPSWPGSNDTLSVWKRTRISTIEGMQFKDIDEDELIRPNIASAKYQYLLQLGDANVTSTTTTTPSSSSTTTTTTTTTAAAAAATITAQPAAKKRKTTSTDTTTTSTTKKPAKSATTTTSTKDTSASSSLAQLSPADALIEKMKLKEKKLKGSSFPDENVPRPVIPVAKCLAATLLAKKKKRQQ